MARHCLQKVTGASRQTEERFSLAVLIVTVPPTNFPKALAKVSSLRCKAHSHTQSAMAEEKGSSRGLRSSSSSKSGGTYHRIWRDLSLHLRVENEASSKTVRSRTDPGDFSFIVTVLGEYNDPKHNDHQLSSRHASQVIIGTPAVFINVPSGYDDAAQNAECLPRCE